MAQALQDKRILIFAADEFEDMELFYPLHRLQEEGAETSVVGLDQKPCHGKHGLKIEPDTDVERVSADLYDAVVIPGGYAPDKLRGNRMVLQIVRDADAKKKPVAAICHAGWVPVSAGIVEGRRMTCFWSIADDVKNAGAEYVDEEVVVDGNLITSRYPPDLGAFCRAIIDAVAA